MSITVQTWYLEFGKVHGEFIRTLVEMIYWDHLFYPKSINDQFYLFKESHPNLFHNLVVNKQDTINDKDPAWMNDNIFNNQICKV